MSATPSASFPAGKVDLSSSDGHPTNSFGDYLWGVLSDEQWNRIEHDPPLQFERYVAWYWELSHRSIQSSYDKAARKLLRKTLNLSPDPHAFLLKYCRNVRIDSCNGEYRIFAKENPIFFYKNSTTSFWKIDKKFWTQSGVDAPISPATDIDLSQFPWFSHWLESHDNQKVRAWTDRPKQFAKYLAFCKHAAILSRDAENDRFYRIARALLIAEAKQHAMKMNNDEGFYATIERLTNAYWQENSERKSVLRLYKVSSAIFFSSESPHYYWEPRHTKSKVLRDDSPACIKQTEISSNPNPSVTPEELPDSDAWSRTSGPPILTPPSTPGNEACSEKESFAGTCVFCQNCQRKIIFDFRSLFVNVSNLKLEMIGDVHCGICGARTQFEFNNKPETPY
ncbi:MAG: hypothetical protein ABW189_01730 [Rickettsiales bacterium]